MADFTPVEIEQLRLLLQKQSELLSIADDAAALDVVAGAGQETINDLNTETAAGLNLADKTVIDKFDSSATKSLAISELVSFVSGQIGGGGNDFNKQGHFKWVAGGGDGGTGYKLKDIVYHNGNTYISTADNNTTEPGAALASWDIFYQDASTSIKGITQLQSTVDDTETNAATPKAINRRDVHDSTKPYKNGARVQNGFGGDWYEAVQDVPANTLITNNAYWKKSFDFYKFSINRKTITASGTYQRTPGAFLAKVLIVGGGGGSGAVQGNATSVVHAASGTCGWGMEFWLSRVDLEATDTTPISVTIGGGGAGAATIATNGSNGGSTVFGSIATVNGGLGSTSQTTHPSTNQVLNTGYIENDLTVYSGSTSNFIRKIQPGLPQPGFQNGSLYAASNTGVSPLGFDLSGSNGNTGAHAALPVDAYGSGGRGRVIYANNQVGVTFAGQNGNNGVVIIEEFFL